MAVLTVTAVSLGSQLIAGIPLLIGLETNLPAVIYYTMDGSEPTVSSALYVEPIQLPTTMHVRLRVFAVSGPDTGVLDISFYSLSGLPNQPRGPVIDAYGIQEVVVDGYGPDELHPLSDNEYPVDIPVRGSDIPLIELETKYSRTGFDGEGPGTLISIGFPRDLGERESAVDAQASSPNNNNAYFNPRSQFIVIDGRDGYQDQSVFIINRPMGGTMDQTKYLGGKSLYEPSPYISGSLVRQFYDYDKRIGVFYYFDSNECRWIKSIQKMEAVLPSGVGMRRGVMPFVFTWIYNKRSMI